MATASGKGLKTARKIKRQGTKKNSRECAVNVGRNFTLDGCTQENTEAFMFSRCTKPPYNTAPITNDPIIPSSAQSKNNSRTQNIKTYFCKVLNN